MEGPPENPQNTSRRWWSLAVSLVIMLCILLFAGGYIPEMLSLRLRGAQPDSTPRPTKAIASQTPVSASQSSSSAAATVTTTNPAATTTASTNSTSSSANATTSPTTVSATTANNASSNFKLTIIHTSENHGHWEPFTQTLAFGGIARRATAIQRIRAEAPNSLLLDSGDVAQGTLYFVQHRLSEAAQFYNALGYDAVNLGNHEFDYGPQTLAQNYVANAKFHIVSTNLDFSAEPLLAGKIPATVIKTINGERIGLLGLTTPELPTASSPGPNIKVKPLTESLKAAVAALEQQGVNKIIVISHLGYPADRTLAATSDGIDVIVSGHTATLLGDAATLPKELGNPDGPYPTVARAPNGKPVLIVHAFDWGKLLGRLNVTFDAQGVAIQWDGAPIVIDTKLTEDAAVKTLLDQLAEPLTAKRKEVIGQTTVELNGERTVVRTRESNLGNLVADAMLSATKNDRTQVALMNGGGIRTGIKAGNITVGQVQEALPFGNRLVQFDLKGAEIIAALENGVSRVNLANASESAGRFPQVAGLRFVWDASRTPRIVSVEVGDAQSGYKALDPNATYRVVTNDFMAGGGDGYEMFKNGLNRSGGDVPIDEVVMEYIKARGTIASEPEGRIRAGSANQFQIATTPAAVVQTNAAPSPVAMVLAPATLPNSGAANWEERADLRFVGVLALGIVCLIGGLWLRR